nr:hypothetical protein [Tanacetum cinerariifolium]
MCQQCGIGLTNGICLNCTYRYGRPLICCKCEGPLRGGFCWFCALNSEISFNNDPNLNSFNDSQNLSDYSPQPQYETYPCELCGNDSHYGYDCPPRSATAGGAGSSKLYSKLGILMINDDEEHFIQYKEYLEKSSNTITNVLPTKELEYSLSMRDEHLKTESDEVIKSSAKNLVPIPSEYEVTSNHESECDVPVKDESSPIFSTFSKPIFDDNDDFTSSDDELLSNEDVQMEDFKFDYLEEFSGELMPISIFDEKTHIFTDMDDLMPSGIESEDYDSEGDIHIFEELLGNETPPIPENKSSNFDHHDDPSFPRPPLEPPDVEIFFELDSGVLTTNVVKGNFEHYVLMPNILPTLPTFDSLYPVYDTLLPFLSENKGKVFKPGILSYLLVSHRDKTTFDFYENPMIVYGGDIPLVDVQYLHFYPP